jgi:cation diffusion facilitator CzcD-associated flavoprotein CzcO
LFLLHKHQLTSWDRCACDVPSHTYTYSWEPKPDWSAVYANSDEIREYFRQFATKYDLWKYIKTNHQVDHAQWSEDAAEWTIRVKDTQTGETTEHKCDIFINASGILNNWKWPDLEGLDDFSGKLLHSANFDRTFDLTGKRVGLIGNGYVSRKCH